MKTFPFHRFLNILLFFWFFPACSQLQEPRRLTAQVTHMIEPHASANLFSGIVLIGSGDSIIYQETFGYADADDEMRNNPDTQFGIGSITKLFTSIITQQLVGNFGCN